VWALVGSLLGVALLTSLGAAYLWRRHKQQQQRARDAAAAAAAAAAETGDSGGSQGEDKLGALTSTGNKTSLACPGLAEGGWSLSPSASSRDHSGDMQSAFMRARFGLFGSDLVLGDVLGRGGFGKVYKGEAGEGLAAVGVSRKCCGFLQAAGCTCCRFLCFALR